MSGADLAIVVGIYLGLFAAGLVAGMGWNALKVMVEKVTGVGQ